MGLESDFLTVYEDLYIDHEFIIDSYCLKHNDTCCIKKDSNKPCSEYCSYFKNKYNLHNSEPCNVYTSTKKECCFKIPGKDR